jgi:hypothetical protein
MLNGQTEVFSTLMVDEVDAGRKFIERQRGCRSETSTV